MFYFVTLLFLLLSAKGTFLYFFNINWFILDFIFIWIGLEYDRFDKRDVKLFVKFSVIYISFCLFRSTFLNSLPSRFLVSDIVYLFKYILPSFLFCAVLKDKALYYLSRLIIDGAIVSIPFFFLQIVAGDTLYNIGRSIGLPPDTGFEYTNFLVFTYIPLHHFQNSGFSWEPGAFGFFLNLGLVLHFLYNNFQLDRRAKILVFAVLTTASTTTYIGLLIVFLLYFRARGIKFSRIALVAVPLGLVVASQLPFLAGKIIDTYNHDMEDLQRIEFLADYYIKMGETMPLNRFSSLVFLYDVLGPQLLFGLSNIYDETIPLLKNINISNGIFEFFAKFGVVGLGFIMFRAGLFFKKFTYNLEQVLYCVILILIQGFGESIFVLPIVTAFCFLYSYVKPEEELGDNEEKEEVVITV